MMTCFTLKMTPSEMPISSRYEVKRQNVCTNCALSHPPRQCPAFKDHCKYCGAIGHWKKCCRKRKSDSRQKSDGRRQKVVYRQEQTSKSRSRRDFSRQPKPIDELSGYTTENDRDDNGVCRVCNDSFPAAIASYLRASVSTRPKLYPLSWSRCFCNCSCGVLATISSIILSTSSGSPKSHRLPLWRALFTNSSVVSFSFWRNVISSIR